jgi:putative drug exporter of the RND superfamily
VSFTERIARACATHPGRTLAAWGVALAAALAAVLFLMGDLTTEALGTNNPESERAEERLFEAFPPDPSRMVTDVVVVRSETYRTEDERFGAFLQRLAAEGRETGALAGGPPSLDRLQNSDDGHAVLIPLFVMSEEGAAELIDVVERADADANFSVAITGAQTRDHDFNLLSERDLQNGELKFGLPAALIILLLVFGTVVAGLVPLLMAIFSILAALGLVAVLSTQFDLSIFIVNMLTGMGLALGIDYSLFVISRYREERGAGREPLGAISASGATASRAVLFSGFAFVVAMFGMFIVPSTIMRALAVGAILVGITSVVAALTLLPALLGLLHDRVDALRLPIVGRRTTERTSSEGRFWGAIVQRVLRRPGLSLAVSAGLLVAAALPILGLNVGNAGISTLPDDLASKRGFLALQRDFGGRTPNPVQVVVEGAGSPAVDRALRELQGRLARDPRFGPGTIRSAGDVAVLEAPVRGDPSGEAAVAAVRELREEVDRMFAGAGADPLVGGTTSEMVDYFDNVTNPAPLVFAFVLALSLVLLTVAFRSVVVAATAILLNFLSVGAAYGLLVLVFQHGVGADLLGFTQADTIEAWVPLFLFSVLFGLSMDYQVFLLSRIRERFDRSRDTRDAVAWGVASTARIITGAALIIVAVFAGFARGDLVQFQQMGFGVAVALLLDATVIRSIVLPSLMALLGDRTWYLPRWLEWIPRLEVEGHAEPGRT